MKAVMSVLTSIPATLVGGVCLVLSLLFPNLPISPAWITVLINGVPLLCSAVRKLIVNRGITRISSALLISMAMIAAIAIGDLFAAGEVAFIMAIGEILEDVTTGRAKRGLKKLLSLAPTQGRRVTDGKEELIPAEQIAIGDILRILPGETIPVDGVILCGDTSVDQSVMTGESLPVDKTEGDEVFCGTINRFGSVDIRATKVGENSTLQTLIHMVQEAENKKAPMARIADKSAAWLVPAALLIAIITGIITQDISRAVTVLVVFCPCALVLATPTAIMAAIGQATKHGVVIKSGEALEKMGHVDTVAFDKTGTLTYGTLRVAEVQTFGTITADDLLALAASAEHRSEHPLAKAIVAHAAERSLPLAETDEFFMSAGYGVQVRIGERTVYCGKDELLLRHGIRLSDDMYAAVEELQRKGCAIVLVADAQTCLGVIALSDTLRPEAADAVARLESLHTGTVLLSGDSHAAVSHLAQAAGVRTVYADLLPEQKVAHIERLREEKHAVCMIGDGVNDAPALKTADVGIAMGQMGSDIAVEAADIALMSDDLSRIPYLKRLANATVRTIRFSITLSMVINVLAVALSVLGWLNPTTGALVHNAGSCFVILIAALLYDRKFK